MLVSNIIASYYMFSKGDVFNYLFVIGEIVALILFGMVYSKLNVDEFIKYTNSKKSNDLNIKKSLKITFKFYKASPEKLVFSNIKV